MYYSDERFQWHEQNGYPDFYGNNRRKLLNRAAYFKKLCDSMSIAYQDIKFQEIFDYSKNDKTNGLCTKEYNRVYIDNMDLNSGDLLATKVGTSDWLRHPIEDILNSAIDAAEDLIKTSPNIQPAYDLSMKQEDAPDEFILSLCNWAAMSQLEWDGLDDISKQTFFDQWLATLSLAVVNVSNGGIRA